MKFTKTFLTIVLLGTLIFSFQSTAWADLTEQQLQQLQQGIEAVEKEDYQTALKLWEPLAEQGDVSAQFSLGSMYYFMYQKDPNIQKPYIGKSIDWYEKAAKQGHVEAQSYLAGIYENVMGNYAEAMKLYKKLAEQGNPFAQAKLGMIYFDSKQAENFKIKRDKVKAKKFFKQACNNSVKEACAMYNFLSKQE